MYTTVKITRPETSQNLRYQPLVSIEPKEIVWDKPTKSIRLKGPNEGRQTDGSPSRESDCRLCIMAAVAGILRALPGNWVMWYMTREGRSSRTTRRIAYGLQT